MTLGRRFRSSACLCALTLLAAFSTSPARADRCDDLAKQLKDHIDGLDIGKTAANLIYLSHPKAREITLGCSGRTYQNQVFARADVRKPTPAFIDLVAGAAAIIFTLPKDDMMRGATRCIQRDGAAARRRRLDPATAVSTCAALAPKPMRPSRSRAAMTSRYAHPK